MILKTTKRAWISVISASPFILVWFMIAPYFLLSLFAFVGTIIFLLRVTPRMYAIYLSTGWRNILQKRHTFPFLLYLSYWKKFLPKKILKMSQLFREDININHYRLTELCQMIKDSEERYQSFFEDAKVNYALGTDLAQFQIEALPLIKNKAGNGLSLNLENLTEWFKIYSVHSLGKRDETANLGDWSSLSAIPFKDIIRNLPRWAIQEIAQKNQYGKELLLHLAAGKNIRQHFPYQLMPSKMAHHFVLLKSDEMRSNGIFIAFLRSIDFPKKLEQQFIQQNLFFNFFNEKICLLNTAMNDLLTEPENKNSYEYSFLITKPYFEKFETLRNKFSLNEKEGKAAIPFFIDIQILNEWKPFFLKIREWHQQNPNINIDALFPIFSYVIHCSDEDIPLQLKGRTYQSMQRLSDEFIAEQERIQRRSQRQAHRNRIRAFQKFMEKKGIEKLEFPSLTWNKLPSNDYEIKLNEEHYCIQQLCNEEALIKEGRRMHHCVGSYANRCRIGEISIWSLREKSAQGNTSLVTIEVRNSDKHIVQMKGIYNQYPMLEHLKIIRQWAKQNELKFSQQYSYSLN